MFAGEFFSKVAAAVLGLIFDATGRSSVLGSSQVVLT
jgi:hypothetical protein